MAQDSDFLIFQTRRTFDKSEISGTGVVAHGIQCGDGLMLLRWHGRLTSLALYSKVELLEEIHGHGGSTKIEWLEADRALEIYHDIPELIIIANSLPAWFTGWV